MRHLNALPPVALAASLLLACSSSGGTKPDAAGGDGDAGATDALAPRDAADGSDARVIVADAANADASEASVEACPSGCATGLVCVAGACLPRPVQVAALPGCGAAQLALSAANIFWTERATGVVRSLPLSSPGAIPTTVATGQMSPGAIATDDTAIFWANEGDHTIMRAPFVGAGPAPLLTAPAAVTALLVNDGTLYYGAGPGSYEVATVGGAPATLMTFPTCRTSRPGALAIDVDHLYQTDFNQQLLTRGKLDGTQMVNDPCAVDPTTAPKIAAPETITHTQGELLIGAVAVSSGQVIWADGPSLDAKPVTGGTQNTQTLAQSAGGFPITGFVVSGSSLYFGETSDPPTDLAADTIEVIPLALGDAGAPNPTIVAQGQRGASQFVANDSNIYWVTKTPPAVVAVDGSACTTDELQTCCGAVCLPNDCAIMQLAK
jgi:hypothetical protein